MSELTAKQKAFIEELPQNQWNGTKGAVAAGYAGKRAGVMAHWLLKNPKIAAELEKRTIEIANKTDVEVGDIIAALCAIAFEGRATNSDRLRALDLLGRYKGIFSEKRIIETVDRQRELSEAEKEAARDLAKVLMDMKIEQVDAEVIDNKEENEGGIRESQNPPREVGADQYCIPRSVNGF